MIKETVQLFRVMATAVLSVSLILKLCGRAGTVAIAVTQLVAFAPLLAVASEPPATAIDRSTLKHVFLDAIYDPYFAEPTATRWRENELSVGLFATRAATSAEKWIEGWRNIFEWTDFHPNIHVQQYSDLSQLVTSSGLHDIVMVYGPYETTKELVLETLIRTEIDSKNSEASLVAVSVNPDTGEPICAFAFRRDLIGDLKWFVGYISAASSVHLQSSCERTLQLRAIGLFGDVPWSAEDSSGSVDLISLLNVPFRTDRLSKLDKMLAKILYSNSLYSPGSPYIFRKIVEHVINREFDPSAQRLELTQ